MIEETYIDPHYHGFFAGRDEGIVTANARPAQKPIVVLDVITLQVVGGGWSLPNGHYLIRNIPPDRQYLLMARDTQRGYEPVAYDWIEPSTVLDGNEQKELWQSWL